MISEQTALNTPRVSSMTAVWHAPFGRQLAALGMSLARLTRDVQAWAHVPALPHAALWEASVVVDLVNGQKFHEPDPVVGEPPFLTDSWLRG
jgi:hypothetical protein